MRWDSPFVLSTAGTVAVHIILIVSGDVLRTYAPPPPKPAPHIELITVEVPPPPPELPPPPPPPEAKEPEPPKPEPTPEPKPEPKPQKIAAKAEPKTEPSEPEEPIKPDLTPGPAAGGDTPVVKLDPSSLGGNGVAHGTAPGGSGKGGKGGGTGNGTGTGASSGDGEGGPPTPVSVATIKKRAMPKGDQSYLGVGKDYPAEAKQLGIEGPIRVKLVVDATGKVASATLITKLGHGLDELALERAKQLEFEPAIATDGTAVTSVVVWTFNMTLPK